ncbi:hypothetical protein B0T16DRAFT_204514 [Cercophora newfieldiana]|uniref:Secreted protein n=1 Tax=Cercophora newfieldiana TaxID=92897 RepID=A0AA39XW67_9PEZI|nr:hypothetical protein B0T16DRAFT_204514 [Cercophora newfieldiana]
MMREIFLDLAALLATRLDTVSSPSVCTYLDSTLHCTCFPDEMALGSDLFHEQICRFCDRPRKPRPLIRIHRSLVCASFVWQLLTWRKTS